MIESNNAPIIETPYNLKLVLNETVEDFRSGVIAKNKVLEAIKRIDKLPFQDVDVYFNDNTWNFAGRNVLPRCDSNYIFYFDENSAYADFQKMYVLNEILRIYTKMPTINGKFRAIRSFFRWFEANYGEMQISDIPYFVYQEYADNIMERMIYTSVLAQNGAIKDFLCFYDATFAEIEDERVIPLLSIRDRDEIDRIIESGKNEAIPEGYRIEMLDVCNNIMQDETKTKNDRIVAACLILYSEIGLRLGELSTVKIDALVEEKVDDKIFKYINFKTYKKAYGDSGTRDSKAFVSQLSEKAFNCLLFLCKERREALGTNYLAIFKNQQKSMMMPKTFDLNYKTFVLRNWKELRSNENAEDSLKPLKVGTYLEKLKKNEQIELLAEFDEETELYFVGITQFRVAVCTNLYKHNVPMQYIKMHMNHLTEEMSYYYIRSNKILDKDISEKIYEQIFKNDAKLLGTNADLFLDKVNKFIENKANMKAMTMDQIIRAVGEAYPLRAKLGGVCIRCGNVIPCPDDNVTDLAYCSFGICGNHCHMYFMADTYYSQFHNQLKIISCCEEKGHDVALVREQNKLKYIVKNSLLPELVEMSKIIDKNGLNYVLKEFPQLEYIALNLQDIITEVKKWN